ncbi:MAG: alpha/beta hydrolase, partial [Achromobacter sp.]|nr:alpha/beta hydrolase [Achromobacter sp.]
MPDPIDTQRRRLLGTTSALAGASLLNLGLGASARAQGAAPTAPRASGAAAFSGLRQIRAGDRDIGYVDAGP